MRGIKNVWEVVWCLAVKPSCWQLTMRQVRQDWNEYDQMDMWAYAESKMYSWKNCSTSSQLSWELRNLVWDTLDMILNLKMMPNRSSIVWQWRQMALDRETPKQELGQSQRRNEKSEMHKLRTSREVQELIMEMRYPNVTWRIILSVYLFTTTYM